MVRTQLYDPHLLIEMMIIFSYKTEANKSAGQHSLPLTQRKTAQKKQHNDNT